MQNVSVGIFQNHNYTKLLIFYCEIENTSGLWFKFYETKFVRDSAKKIKIETVSFADIYCRVLISHFYGLNLMLFSILALLLLIIWSKSLNLILKLSEVFISESYDESYWKHLASAVKGVLSTLPTVHDLYQSQWEMLTALFTHDNIIFTASTYSWKTLPSVMYPLILKELRNFGYPSKEKSKILFVTELNALQLSLLQSVRKCGFNVKQ